MSKLFNLALLLQVTLCTACPGYAIQSGGRSAPRDAPASPRSSSSTPASSKRRTPERKNRPSSTPVSGRAGNQAADAELTISSNPSNCSVYFNGQLKGETSADGLLNIPALAPGQYEITLRKSGYMETSRTIQITNGQSHVINIELAPPYREPVTIDGGVLNGKAISLPKPAYPAEARDIGASGVINVRVLVDESGQVISVTAEQGHPALQRAAEAAARQARFQQATSSGQFARVSGIVTYNFVSSFASQSFRAPSGHFQVVFPRVWEFFPQGNDYVTLAPPNGLQKHANQTEVLTGAIVAFIPARGVEQMTLDQAMNAMLATLLKGNEYLHEEVNNRRRESLAGANAMTTMLAGRGSGGYDERVALIVRPSGRGILYLVFVAPAKDFSSYEATFKQIAQSLVVTIR
jgi:TonB family protein